MAPSANFLVQLQKIFAADDLQPEFVKERCDAAYAYFFKILDNVTEELLLKIEEIKRTKKVKAFYDELAELEELQIRTVIQLKKVKLLTQTIVEGKEISKQNLISEDCNVYKINKLVLVSERFKKLNIALVEDDDDVSYYTDSKRKKQKNQRNQPMKIR